MATAQFTRPEYPPRKRSLLFDPDLTPGETNVRNQRLDLGLDPDNPGQALVGASGITTAFNRNTNRMLEGFRVGGAGARQLTAGETTDAAALRDGTGSVYDNPRDPRHYKATAKFYANAVEPTRARHDGLSGEEFVPQGDIFEQQTRDDLAVAAAKMNAENRARKGHLSVMQQRAAADARNATRPNQGGTMTGGARPVRPVSFGDQFATDKLGDPASYIAPGLMPPAVRGVTPIEGGGAPVQRAAVLPDQPHEEPGDRWTRNMAVLNAPPPAPTLFDRVTNAAGAPFRRASDFYKRQVKFLDEKTKDWPERKAFKFGQ